MAYTLSSSPVGAHFGSITSPSMRSLLGRSIDYAGLFPPADLSLDAALKNHAAYVRSDETGMLNTLVLPIAKFSAAAAYLSAFDLQHPLRISALAGKSENAADFQNKLATAVEAIRQLQAANGELASVVQLEIALPDDCDRGLLGELEHATRELALRVFCEAPPDDAERTIALLAQTDTTQNAPLGYKLRTGGVTADAFPTPDKIARALVAAARDSVPIKFTAGLHHPVRQFRDEVKAKMYGFLNVLGAGVLAAEHSWDEATTAQMLEDENPASFVFEKDTFSWQDWKISADAIKSRRELVTSFGSCSFDEPRDDLRALHFL